MRNELRAAGRGGLWHGSHLSLRFAVSPLLFHVVNPIEASAMNSTKSAHNSDPEQPPVPQRRSAGWWVRRLLPAGAFLVVGLLLIVVVGFAQRLGWISAGGSQASSSSAANDQIHTCPMHPQIRQPGPGRCPICGMELVPAQSGGTATR